MYFPFAPCAPGAPPARVTPVTAGRRESPWPPSTTVPRRSETACAPRSRFAAFPAASASVPPFSESAEAPTPTPLPSASAATTV